MTSKEALELLYRNCSMTVVRENDGIHLYSEYLVEQIKQDLDKLEKLEKVIEILKEKIGIDLITLLKALESGVWVKEWKEPIKHTCGLKFSKYGKYWILENKTYCLDLKEYGKNWALTRKELENDK